MMRYVKIIVGNLLMTSAYAFFTVPQKIINGGGDQFFMILCYVFLGREYFKGTIIGGACYMLFFTAFHSFGLNLIPVRPLAAVMFCINTCVLMLGIFQYGVWAVILGISFTAVQSFVLNTLLKRQLSHNLRKS